MTRETKAQRLAREATVAEKYRADFLSSYPTRLLDLVYYYSNKNPSKFSVDRVDDTNFLFETTQEWSREFVLPRELTEYSRNVDLDLMEAEDALKAYAAEVAEEVRKSAVKTAALKRVTELFNEEERKLLGL